MSGFTSTGITPSLIHVVKMKIQRYDSDTTVVDDVYREEAVPGVKKYQPVQEIYAQIHWMTADKHIAGAFGDDIIMDGWITMRDLEIKQFGGPFDKGDKIIEIDGDDYGSDPLFIEEVKPAGHYGKKSLWKFFFKTRSETTGNDT